MPCPLKVYKWNKSKMMLGESPPASLEAAVSKIKLHGFAKAGLPDNGYYLLCDAIDYGHLSLIELLLANNCKIAERGVREKQPIHLAVQNGFPKIVKTLLERHADPNCEDRHWRTPLYFAIASKMILSTRMEILKLLVHFGANVNKHSHMYHNDSPLHTAVFKNNLRVTKFLLDRGANPNAEDMWGENPLYYAQVRASKYRPGPKKQIIDLLVAHGARNKIGGELREKMKREAIEAREKIEREAEEKIEREAGDAARPTSP